MAPKPRKPSAIPAQPLVIGPSGPILVAVRHSPRAKQLTLRFAQHSDAFVLTLPAKVPVEAAKDFLQRNVGWMELRKSQRLARTPFVDGAMIPVRGVPHRVVHRSLRSGVTVQARDPDGHPIIAVHGNVAGVPGRIRAFLLSLAKADLTLAATRYAAIVGRRVASVAIRDTKTRWGSCSSRGTLSFSWRLIMAPDYVLDYLAAHEVAHLREMNHSDRYWRLARELCPRLEEAEAWLAMHGKSLHSYG